MRRRAAAAAVICVQLSVDKDPQGGETLHAEPLRERFMCALVRVHLRDGGDAVQQGLTLVNFSTRR